MKKFITHLQEKPESHRARIAFGVASSVTAIVFLMWVTTLGTRLTSDDTLTATNEPSDSVAAVPFGGSAIEEQLQQLQNNFGAVKSSIEVIGQSYGAEAEGSATSSYGSPEYTEDFE